MSASEHPGDKLSAYLDDELSPAERTAVDQHLRDCAPCGQLLEELAAVDAASRSLTVQAPQGYFEAFPSRVRERLAARRVRRIPAWTWAAAAALLLAVITPLTLRDRPRAPASAEMPAAGPSSADRAAQDESSLSRAQPAAPAATAPATTLTAEMQDRMRSLGYVGDVQVRPPAKEREFRQKQDAALDDRLRERDGNAHASRTGAGAAGDAYDGGVASGVSGGVVGGVSGGVADTRGRRGADLKDGELKKESVGEKSATDKLNQNGAPPPASAPVTPVPEAVVVNEPPQLAARADEYAAQRKRAEAPTPSADGDKAAAPPPAESPRGQAEAKKPAPAQGSLRAAKTAAAPARVLSSDEGRFAEEFEAIASRPLRQAEQARTAARQWDELARQHPQAGAADEARVRAIEAWATAFRLEHKDADRDQARQAAKAYLAGKGPQKDRVRAVLDQLAR